MSAASNSQCPVCRTAEVVCGKWTLLVIRDLAEGSSRFCELERSLEGISPRTLSLRLRALEEEGIVERHTFPEVPPRVEYALTEKGEALVPLVEDMRRYGTRWLFEDAPAEAEPRRSRSALVTSILQGVRAGAGAPGTGGKPRAVRDRLLNESLTRLASEAAIRLSSLVAAGDQIPFDVDAESGDDSLFYSYRPLTSVYVRERDERAARARRLRPGPRRGRRRRHRRRLPGSPRRAGPRRPGRARRADADRLPRLALGRLHRTFARSRAPA